MGIILKSKNLKLLKKQFILLIIILICNFDEALTLCEEFREEVIEKSTNTNTDEISYKKKILYLGLAAIICLAIYFVFFGSSSNEFENNACEIFQNKLSISWIDVAKQNLPYVQLSSEIANTIHWTNMSVDEYLKIFPGNTLVAFLPYTPEFHIDPNTLVYQIVTLEEIRNLNLNLSSHIL